MPIDENTLQMMRLLALRTYDRYLDLVEAARQRRQIDDRERSVLRDLALDLLRFVEEK